MQRQQEGSSAKLETTPGVASALQRGNGRATRHRSPWRCWPMLCPHSFLRKLTQAWVLLEQSLGRGSGWRGAAAHRSPQPPDWEAQLLGRCPCAGVGLSLLSLPHLPASPPSHSLLTPSALPLSCGPCSTARRGALGSVKEEGTQQGMAARGPQAVGLVSGLGWGGQAGQGVAGQGCGSRERLSVWLTAPPLPLQGAPRICRRQVAAGPPRVAPFPEPASVSHPHRAVVLGTLLRQLFAGGLGRGQ